MQCLFQVLLTVCASHCHFSMCCRAWETFFVSSTHHNQCISIINQFVVDDNFFVYNLLFYYFINGIVVFFHDMCSCAIICFILLMDGFLSLSFFIQTIFFFLIFFRSLVFVYVTLHDFHSCWTRHCKKHLCKLCDLH
jgi:hypothetical protein